MYFPMTKETLVYDIIVFDGQTGTISDAHIKKSGSTIQDNFFLTKKEENIFLIKKQKKKKKKIFVFGRKNYR